MKRLLMFFSYIGTNYRGLQRNLPKSQHVFETKIRPDLDTVQGILEFGLNKVLLIDRLSIYTSSRTDTGVHAIESTVQFDFNDTVHPERPYSPETICQKLNIFLEKNECDIRVKRVVEVPNDFNCRKAYSRIYEFRVAVLNQVPCNVSNNLFSPATNIRELNRCTIIREPFDVGSIQNACQLFLGQHNFSTFMKSSTRDHKPEGTRVKTLRRITLSREIIPDSQWDSEDLPNSPYDIYTFTIEGSGFLRRQVRRMVGALVAVGRGLIGPNDIVWMLNNPSEQNWNNKIVTLGPDGLYLKKINYAGLQISRISMDGNTPNSFLDQLQYKLKGLKATTTKTTFPDGSVHYTSAQGSSTESKESGKTFGFVVDEKPDLTIGQVTDFLFVSSQDVAGDKEILTKLGISHILSLLPGFNLPPEISKIVTHLVLEVYDEEYFSLNSDSIYRAFEFINDGRMQNGKILVHCNAGISRAPSLVVAYLMKRENLSLDCAWDKVKSARPAMRPNAGFMKQLKEINK